MLEQLVARLADVDNASAKGVMTRLASLFALWTMEQNLRWFISTRLLNATDVDVIEVGSRLCQFP